MLKRSLAGLGALAVVSGVVWPRRRRLLANWLDLPPPRYDVGVERGLVVPMPDGVRLYADRYYPKAQGAFPTILIRTPYGRRPVGISGLFMGFAIERLVERGYNVVVQDVRGRFDSEGEFTPFFQEAADGRATLEWIAQQPWFEGNLATWGASYLGYTQWALAPDAPPYLKAMVPMITSASARIFVERVFGLEVLLRWLVLLALPTRGRLPLWESLALMLRAGRIVKEAVWHLPVGEADLVAVGEPVPFFREWMQHEDENDPYWEPVQWGRRMERVQAAVHWIGGWYDFFLYTMLRDYRQMRALGKRPYLTIGPWHHLSNDGMVLRVRESLAWFDAHLKNDPHALREKPVRVYLMGAEEWRDFDDWPPPEAQPRRFYLHPDRTLRPNAPEEDAFPSTYRYDPADPTPAIGGALFDPSEAGPRDNRELEARHDVLLFTSPPLDADLDVIGDVRVVLYARSSVSHTDFAARLNDVHPDGTSYNVCDGLFRVTPEVVEQVDEGLWRIEIDLWGVAHRFKKGHRLRLVIASAFFPRFNRNLNTGEPVATGTRMVVAEQYVYHDKTHPSYLEVSVVES